MRCKHTAVMIVLLALQMLHIRTQAAVDGAESGELEQLPRPRAPIDGPDLSQREAPDVQRIFYNSSASSIIVVSAALPAGCSCRLGVRDVQDANGQPDAITWTQLLTTNIIAGSMPSGENALHVDCSDDDIASQRCRAERQHLLFVDAASAADTRGHVAAAGTSVIEAAIRVTASPAAARDDDCNHSCNHSCEGDLQSNDAPVDACNSLAQWAAKWAARAVFVFLTAGLTFLASP